MRSSDIADSLAVTRPSVYKMTAQLLKMKLITKERYSTVRMTKKGRAYAENYQLVFDGITGFLYGHINLPADSAGEGALAILGRLNNEKVEMICTQMKKESIHSESEKRILNYNAECFNDLS